MIKARLAILLALGTLALALTATMTLADDILCRAGIRCVGTLEADLMTGTKGDNVIGAGADVVNDILGPDKDVLRDGPGNDTINSREENKGQNNKDFVNCGPDEADAAIIDRTDQHIDCETVNFSSYVCAVAGAVRHAIKGPVPLCLGPFASARRAPSRSRSGILPTWRRFSSG